MCAPLEKGESLHWAILVQQEENMKDDIAKAILARCHRYSGTHKIALVDLAAYMLGVGEVPGYIWRETYAVHARWLSEADGIG